MSIIGSVFGNKQRKDAAAKANEFSAYMSNTSYQRGMADMRKAGLNPILAYQQGGASTPTGQMPILGNVGEGLAETAISAKQTQTAAKTGRSTREMLTAQSTKLGTASAVDVATAEKVSADARMSNIQANIAATRIPAALNEMSVDTGNTGRSLAHSKRYKESTSIQAWLREVLGQGVSSAKGWYDGEAFRQEEARRNGINYITKKPFTNAENLRRWNK